MNKPRITTTIDYELIKLLKKQAKEQNYSVSELVESIIEKHFYEEKSENKLNEIESKINTLQDNDKTVMTFMRKIVELLQQDKKGEQK